MKNFLSIFFMINIVHYQNNGEKTCNYSKFGFVLLSEIILFQ